jgi:outer membrane lipoprotein-sorting protein
VPSTKKGIEKRAAKGLNPLPELVTDYLSLLLSRRAPLRFRLTLTWLFFAAGLLAAMRGGALAPLPRKGKLPPDLSQILSRMNEAAKRLKTLSANLEYTKVTVLVNDKSTEEGRLFYRKGKTPEIRIEFQQPESKIILFKKNKAEVYLPKINQLQEFNLEQKSGMVEGFLLLGFGSETGELKKSYDLKYLKEEDIDGDTTAVLELTPRKASLASQLTKIQMWVSEDSWLPAQQQFFEPGGDYLIARYKAVKVNLGIPSSTFEIHPAAGAKRVKMN